MPAPAHSRAFWLELGEALAPRRSGLDVGISAHQNRTLGCVRLGFDDGDPQDAPVDPSRMPVVVDLPSALAPGPRVATVTVTPQDRNGTALGRGLKVSVDEGALLPAVLGAPIADEGNGRYTFSVIGVSGQVADIVITVEGTVIAERTVIYF